jgi:hypothetical protein
MIPAGTGFNVCSCVDGSGADLIGGPADAVPLPVL